MAEEKGLLAGGGTRLRGWVIALCLLPLLLLAAVFVFKAPVSALFLVGALLLCPLLHLFVGHSHGGAELDQHHLRTGPTSRLPR